MIKQFLVLFIILVLFQFQSCKKNDSISDSDKSTVGDIWQKTSFPTISVWSLSTNSQGHIFVGTDGHGIYRSKSNGSTWDSINSGLTLNNSLRIGDILVNNDGSILVGTYDGIYRSSNNGDTWIQVHPKFSNSYYVWSIVKNSSGIVFAATGQGGVYKSTNNGISWDSVFSAGDIETVLTGDNQNIFAANYDGDIYRSVDEGNVWTKVFSSNYNFLFLRKNSNGVIFAVTDADYTVNRGSVIFRSSNNGTSWDSISVLPTVFGPESFTCANSNTVFTGLGFHGVYKSNDNGKTWKEFNANLSEFSVTNIFELLVDSSGILWAGTNNGLYKTKSSGLN